MRNLMIGILVFFSAFLVFAWIAAERANPKMLNFDEEIRKTSGEATQQEGQEHPGRDAEVQAR